MHDRDSSLAHAPDVYFSEGYGRAEEAAGAGEWLRLEAHEGRWQMPVHIRREGGFVDAVSPYGYSGIYAAPGLDADSCATAWEGVAATLRQMGVLSLFLRQSPFYSPELPPQAVRLNQPHPTVCIPVGSEDDVWKGMAGRCRTSCRKAEKLGVTGAVRAATAQDLRPSSAFRRLYEGAMLRREATQRYFFPDAYYERLKEALQGNLLLAEARDQSGDVVASTLLLRHGRRLHYHLSGSDPAAGRLGATNLLLWEAARWACSNSLDEFHLGGGVTDRDSLFRFKESFGGTLLDYSTHGITLDPVGFRDAVVRRSHELERPFDSVLNDPYYPQFRAGSG
ncbi:MAG: GNAT family N-acetyltransferase [Nocardioides sp.]|nr:GNAT family N-acetyltransferase [Nocardioides sp.]